MRKTWMSAKYQVRCQNWILQITKEGNSNHIWGQAHLSDQLYLQGQEKNQVWLPRENQTLLLS